MANPRIDTRGCRDTKTVPVAEWELETTLFFQGKTYILRLVGDTWEIHRPERT